MCYDLGRQLYLADHAENTITIAPADPDRGTRQRVAVKNRRGYAKDVWQMLLIVEGVATGSRLSEIAQQKVNVDDRVIGLPEQGFASEHVPYLGFRILRDDRLA